VRFWLARVSAALAAFSSRARLAQLLALAQARSEVQSVPRCGDEMFFRPRHRSGICQYGEGRGSSYSRSGKGRWNDGGKDRQRRVVHRHTGL
jgi:hypothetical protein